MSTGTFDMSFIQRSFIAGLLGVTERPVDGWTETSMPLGVGRLINTWSGDALTWERDTVQHNTTLQAEQFTANDVRLWQYADVRTPQPQIEKYFGGAS